MKKGLVALLIGVCLLLSAVLVSADGKLVIYNAGPPEMGDALAQAFKAKYRDIDVAVIRQGSGELITRIQAEARRPQGDIILAVAKENLDVIYDLLDSYRVKEASAFPNDMKDAKGNKYFGFSFNIQAFMINTDRVPLRDAPKSWKDLGDSKYRGEVVMANPALSGSAYAQLFQMVGLYGWDHINAVRRVTTFVPSSTLVYTFVGRGEFGIGVTGEGNVFTEKAKGNPVEAVYPSEGTGLRFDASGIIKGGPNPQNARIFMDWLTTKEVMTIISQAPFFRRMTRPDVPPPPGLTPTSEVKFFEYDANKASDSRDEYLQKFGEIFATR
ncbi:MAG: extracellular solute-binding protein [Spirochaetaceae bacterium]|nr:MAG: extracellular solute-binding protein [Spirochaetaceae bacterium]